MSIQYQDFIHPSDKKALDALKAIPGFDLVSKKCMSIIGEKMFQIATTSSYLKLGPDQLPEIYEILVRVCNRLQMDVPELYLSLDRSPNACTFGDTSIYIVLNSGLLETMTLDQIETVIAHECGHIVCHHVLYHTMGRYILIAADAFANGLVSSAIVTSLKYAFAYWMRCSEFSADRVAAYYHGSASPVVDLMMALSGGTRNLMYKLNREAFFKQAQNYKVLVDNSSYNKVLEFIQFGSMDHPLNAYRAYEINEFYKNYTIKRLSDPNEKAKESTELSEQYNLRIRYEFIRPKLSLKKGGTFGGKELEVTIAGTKYTIDKNSTKDIRLESGQYELLVSNSKTEKKLLLLLKYDMSIVVSWDGNTQELSIREEI